MSGAGEKQILRFAKGDNWKTNATAGIEQRL
jgi:hypothetical protein